MRDRQYFIDNFDRAIGEKWIRVYYQPIVRSTNGKICGQEALSRWIDPDGDIYTPDEFIPVLEEADLICRLDLYVIDQILERVHIQEEIGMPDVRQSVNISEKDFFACDLPEEIRRRVDDAGYPRNMLALEIEENAVAGDYSFIKDQIERLHGMGFPVWLDTYGNACFSVDLFRRTSLDLIKFDLDYIRQFESEEAGRIVLSELMKMTIGLGIDTVCEGVETEEEERFLREIGCEKLQGYFYGEAVPFEMIQELFRESTEFRSRMRKNRLTMMRSAVSISMILRCFPKKRRMRWPIISIRFPWRSWRSGKTRWISYGPTGPTGNSYRRSWSATSAAKTVTFPPVKRSTGLHS